MQTTKKYIAYYRVSTDKQGLSKLGLEAQKTAVSNYISPETQLIAEYVEIESGKKKNRPELLKALSECKKQKAVLIIAKLDRLARNVHFISGLIESGIEFIAVDNPHANKLMLHMLAAFAEHEREMISTRTKQALQAARSRGVNLGAHGKKLAVINHNKAKEFSIEVYSRILEMKATGLTTLGQIANELNRINIPTFHNKGIWHVATVCNLIKRAEYLKRV